MANQKKEFPDEDEIIYGIIDRIMGTSVFVKLEGYDKEGVISFSEVAAGRIRNIRDYVKIGQKTILRVLRVDREKNHIDLSLRRVTQKEKKELVAELGKEKEFFSILNLVLNDKIKAQEILNSIKSQNKFIEIFDKFPSNPEDLKNILKPFIDKHGIEKILTIMTEKVKTKKVEVKAKFSLFSDVSDGIEKIKKLLIDIESKGAKIHYLGAPHYSITVEDTNYKDANKKIKALMEELQLNSKNNNCKLEFDEKIK
jgi:translation initiation factor 2 subunit 1